MIGFSDKIIEHFQNPRNVGIIENPEGIAKVINPVCGDITKIYLRIKKGVIIDAKFKSLGCAVTIASASVFTEKIKGRRISDLISGTDEKIVNQLVALIESELGKLPAKKLHCPPATVQAFLESIMRYNKRKGTAELVSRIESLIPLVNKYYQRGKESENDAIY
ncbi:MAG: iron-sulfur cluster assembly scaffold protein [Candidatus Aminicenantaceae bacterium]